MTPEQNAFFKTTVPAAQASQAATGVPASVTLAQAILESGWGNSALARECNNFFGIKPAHLSSPGSYVEFKTKEGVRIGTGNGPARLVTETQPFVKYATVADGFTAHGALLGRARRYARCMAVRNNANQFAAMLQACGYSTSVDAQGVPDYARKLQQLIREFDLTQYDSSATPPPGNGGGKPLPVEPASTNAQSVTEVPAAAPAAAAKEAA